MAITTEPKWRTFWPLFETVMQARLDRGHLNYGDISFNRAPAELLDELEQEALDIVGWGFILWTRLVALKVKVGQLERP